MGLLLLVLLLVVGGGHVQDVIDYLVVVLDLVEIEVLVIGLGPQELVHVFGVMQEHLGVALPEGLVLGVHHLGL